MDSRDIYIDHAALALKTAKRKMCEINLTNQLGEDILGLLIASDELLLDDLFKHVQDFLIEKCTSWIQQNFILVLHSVFQLASQENFERLKETLSQFIPLIRFVGISCADFFDKVRPYKAVFPQQIYEEFYEFYYKGTISKSTALPSRAGLLKSTIIDPKLATILANWIDKNDSAVHSFNNKFKFNLIYIKSRDGSNISNFNKLCNGQGPFVIFLKSRSKKIYGGYNPIGYASRIGKWLSSSDSFIFSFENGQDIHNMKIGRSKNTAYSIYEHNDKKFIDFGSHLFNNHGEQTFFLSNYENFDNIFNLNYGQAVDLPVEEIEVFSISKK
ncbi:5879_t:CDS:2 [Funneliformis mosseae]|uniref:5879_t:CDS:1 n=1 Tax=Funneliformis mosseae TaxID=27381 RepID=A0A9N9HC90_FUNMO|nr:5879_t:CDS:2 [Funneliformis mosseae]